MASQSSKSSAPLAGNQSLASDAVAAKTRAAERSARWLWIAAAGAVTLIALIVRVWTAKRGLPYVDHPDEPNPINYVIGMLKTGDLNPHAFQKPSLYVYLLLGVLAIQYRLGLASGMYTNIDTMFITTHVYTTVPQFFLWGRFLTATIGALSVLAVFFVNWRLWGAGAGLIAALFLAASPFHLRNSQYVTTDVLSGLFVLLSFVFSVLLAERGRWRDYLLAGLFAGFAASTKYNVGVAAIPIVVAHVLHWRGKSFVALPRLIAAGTISLLGFVIGTPYALLSFNEFWRGMVGQAGDYSKGEHGDLTGAWNWRGYLDFFTSGDFGWLPLLATIAGLGLMFRRQYATTVLWLSFVVPYLLLHLAQSSHFMRNMIPLFVLAALPIGIACVAVIQAVGTRASWLRPIAAGVVLAVLLWVPIVKSWEHSARMAGGDTRVLAMDWINAHAAPGTRIAAELRPIPGPIESRWTEVNVLPPHGLAWYRQQGFSYILASSDVWRQWEMPAEYAQYDQPVAEFGGPTAQTMLGPNIKLYSTGLSPADVPRPLPDTVVIGGAQFLGTVMGTPSAEATDVGLTTATSFKAGGVLGLRTFWKVTGSYDHDYLIFVHIIDANGATVAQRDAPPWQGRFPTTSWQPGSIVVDVNDVALPATMPPGTYTIAVGMYSPELNAHPPLTIDGVVQGGGEIQLGTITVEQ